jgi:hypothetical protein
VDHANPEIPGDCTFPGRPLVDPAGKFCKDIMNPARIRFFMDTEKANVFLLFRKEKRGEPDGLSDHHGEHP